MSVSVRIPLSDYQRDIWVASSRFPTLPQYTVYIHERYEGPLAADRLAQALSSAALDNEAFRLRFGDEDGLPFQWLADAAPPVELVDLSAEPDPASAVRRWLADAAQVAYDVTGDHLADLVVLRESAEVHHAYVRTHHLVSDAWGLRLFMAQVRAHYCGDPEVAPPSYLEVQRAAEERDREGRPGGIAHFEQTLTGVHPALFTRRAAAADRRFARHRFTLERALVDGIRDRGESPFLLFSAAVALYLAQVHQTDDVVIGVPVLNRTGRVAKRAVGQFANTLPLRVDATPAQSTAELLAAMRGATRALLRHEDVPLGDVLRAVPREGSAPLFDTTIAYLKWPAATPIDGVAHTTAAETHAHEQDALAIWVSEFDAESPITVDVEYAADVFDADFPIEAAARHIEALLSAMAGPFAPVAELSVLSPDEHADLVFGRNATDADFPSDATLAGLFAEQAARTPNAVAIVEPDGAEVTYAALRSRADAVAHALRGVGVGRDDRVVVLVERGPHLLPAILGTLIAGAAYVPVDPTHPRERVRMLIEDCGASVVLAGSADVLPERAVLSVADLPAAPAPVDPVAGARDLAYVIYTSGSTGRPKGVMVEHRSVVNRLWWMQRRYPIGPGDVLLQKTPVSFDVSVWELFWWGFTGARLALLPPGAEKDPRAVLRAIARDGVTVAHFVPSMLGPLLDLIEAEPAALGQAALLRTVFCSGEALPPAQVARFNRLLGGSARLANLYGPTEATVDVSFYDCPPGAPARIPIGRPIDNIRLYVLDRQRRPQPVGVPGELHIGGVGVARGYLGRPELTGERFVDDPFVAGGVLYRTGDRARWLADGELEYLGRLDDQVKIRGNRVEPGEVRDQLAALPGVRDAVVIDRVAPGRGRHLVGYVVGDVDTVDLRAELTRRVPEFMVPAFLVRVDGIPLTPNGKADRTRLPEPEAVGSGVLPRTPVEAALAEVWAEVLGVPSVGVYDDYYALGGDSILMLRLRARAEQRGLGFELSDLVAEPTVAALAGRVGVAGGTDLPPFALVSEVDRSRLGEGIADAFPVSRLALGLLFHTSRHPGSAVYRDVFQYSFRMRWDEAAFRRTVEDLTRRYPALRSSFDLAGFSEPLQLVHAEVPAAVLVVDLRGGVGAASGPPPPGYPAGQGGFAGNSAPVDSSVAVDSVAAHVLERRHHDYAVDRPELHLFAAHVMADDVVELVFSFHHAVLDGWSVANLIADLVRTYRVELGLSAAPAPEVPPAASTHVRAERAAMADPGAAGYWAGLLDGAATTALDGFRAHEAVGDGEFVHHRVDLDSDVVAGLRAMAVANALPVKAVLLAAHCLTLRVFTASGAVVTGVVTHGRPELPGADRMAGLFLNTVPVRFDAAAGSWLGAARAVFAQERAGHRYRRYPLSEIQQAHGGVLQSAFNFVNLHVIDPLREDEQVRLADFQVWEETNFPLFVNAIADPMGEGVFLRVDTDGRTVTRSQAALVGGTFAAILRRMVERPDESVDFGFLAPGPVVGERAEPLVDVVTRIREQMVLHPDAPAVSMEDTTWSYRELDRVSAAVAGTLLRGGAEPGATIGVAMSRSPEMIAAVFGIIRAGLVCVPLDVSYPKQRLALILDTARPFRVLAHPQHEHVAQDPSIVVRIADAMVDESEVELPAPGLDNLMCMLFTSGSTGRPKGVELTHRMWANYVQWQLRVPSGLPGESTLQFAPLSFDMSFQEILSTLGGGGELRMVAEQERLDPPALLRLLDRYAVRRVLLPFVALQRLAEASKELGLRPSALRVVVSSGEQLRVTEDIRAFCAALPGLLLENQYGPTETHQVTYHSLVGDPASFPALPPIGRPLDGVEVLVLDADLHPVSVGATGEIHIGGDCLARGYHCAPELTEERFIPHPHRSGERLYRTGDLGRVLPGGEVVWLGRADTQVKVRGFRIETAEVELAIMRQAERWPGIAAAAVVARERGGSDAFLAAFLRGDNDGVDVEELRSVLRAELPDYMVPAQFAWVDAFPLTPSGKRDDSALRALPLVQDVVGERLAPRDEYERTLADILAELLDVPAVGVRDDFFAIGGTSLTAMRMVVTIEKRYGVSVPLAALIETPTVEGLAARLRDRSAVSLFDPLVPIRTEGDRPPLFLVHPLGGHVLCYLAITRSLAQDQPVYALQAAGSDQGSTPLGSIPEMAASYLAAIRRARPDGPYVLAGWSFGGFVAYEMARQLKESDPDAAAQVIVLDSITIRRGHDVEIGDDALMEFFYWELVWFERIRDEVRPLPAELTTVDAKLDRILADAVRTGVLPHGTSRSTVRRLYNLFRANWRALIDYRPDPTDLDVALLRADGPLPAALRPMHEAAGTMHGEPDNGWRDWTTGELRVVDVPGDHLVLMDDPHVGAVAAAVAALVDRHWENP